MAAEIISVILAYILGSISSAYIIGRLVGKIDMSREDDGRISASAAHKKLGVIPFLLVVVIDVGEGALAVLIARLLTDSLIVVLLAGFAAVVGHNWSVFLKFKGGLGATTTYGVLLALVWWQTLIAAAVAGILFFTILKKSGLSTAILIGVLSVILLAQYIFQNGPLILVFYPVVLILLMLLKRFQIGRKAAGET